MLSRLRRRDYALFTLLFGVVAFVCLVAIEAETAWADEYGAAVLPGLLLGLVASYAMAIKRLHDINASGWWAPLLLLPVTNVILGLVLIFKDGTPGPNQYGDDPKRRPARPS